MLPYPFGFLQSGDTGDTEFIMLIDATVDGDFTVRTTGGGYDYNVDWGDGNTTTGATGNVTHTFVGGASSYVVKISENSAGGFPRIYFANNAADDTKLLEIQNWGTNQWASMDSAFDGCQNMTITATDEGDFSNVANWHEAFKGCSSITTSGLSANWITSNATSLLEMFQSCTALTTCDTSNWDTSNVEWFDHLFYGNTSLSNIDVSNWDTGSALGLGNCFYACESFTSLDVSNWDVSLVRNFSGVFRQCVLLTSLDVSSWNVSSVTHNNGFWNMFRRMLSLTSLDLGSWNVGACKKFTEMFYQCGELTTIGDVDGWDITNGDYFNGMFNDCSKLTINFPSWGPFKVGSSLYAMFQFVETGVGSITGYDSWDVSNVANFAQCFYGTDDNLATVPSTWDMRGATTLEGTFRQWEDVFTGSIDMSNTQWDSSCTNMYNTFRRNQTLTDITFGSNNDFSGVTTMQWMFYQANSLTDITWDAGLDLSALTNATSMITGGKMSNTSYNLFLNRMRATWNPALVAGNLDVGNSEYTETILVSSSADGTTANKLVDNGEDFITLGVQINDIVHNTTDNSYAKITAIDDLHTLSLNADIMVSGDNYSIDTGTPAKDKEYLESEGWAITDAN